MRGIARMTGRDPRESGRVATPLELLFDLTFVVAVGVGAAQLAELIATSHLGPGLLGFVFTMFAILVGWINFSWFASAFDIDDWAYRLCTMVQMAGVVVLTLGIPAAFHSIEVGDHVDVRLLVAGYVVMRIGMLLLWLRCAAQNPEHRRVALRNALWLVLVQCAWVLVALVDLTLVPTFVLIVLLGAMELLLPVITQGRAHATPWHPHHIAERYSAFAIIALGEGVVGTVASSSAVGGGTLTVPTALLIAAGVGITFALWWMYFLTPFGALLHRRPGRGYLFGYGHIPVLLAIAATGSGLHGAGLFVDGESVLGASGAVLGVAVPVAVYLATVYGLRALLEARFDRSALGLLLGALATIGLAVAGSAFGAPVTACLLVVAAASFIPVIGIEVAARRRDASRPGTTSMVPTAPE